jgi:predicted nucleic acid-binding protein
VLDASVVAKWALEEAGTEKALRIRELFLRDEVVIAMPALAFYEIGNILRFKRAVRPAEAAAFLELLHGYAFDVHGPSAELTLMTDAVSRKYGLTFYDASYIAVAQKAKGIVVTADGRMAAQGSKSGIVQTLDEACDGFFG